MLPFAPARRVVLNRWFVSIYYASPVWALSVLCGLAAALLLPLLALAWSLARGTGPWLALLGSSVRLAAAVTLVSGLLGVGLAVLTAFAEFPGRRFFRWALLLPLAMPPYVLGYTLLAWQGPLQAQWLEWFGAAAPLPPLSAFGGLVLSLSLSLYPYVYLAARHAVQTQSGPAIDAARGLGAGAWAAFFFAGLPAARPWIAVGLTGVALDCWADLGTVTLFGYDTLTTAVCQQWAGLATPPPVLRSAGVVLLLALLAFAYVQHQQRGQARHLPFAAARPALPRRLPSGVGWLACLGLAAVWTLAFLLPLLRLLIDLGDNLILALDPPFLVALGHSLGLAAIGATLALAAAALLAFGLSRTDSPGLQVACGLIGVGEYLPGAALALGLACPAVTLWQAATAVADAEFAIALPPLLDVGMVLLWLAYLLRFAGSALTLAVQARQAVAPALVLTAQQQGWHGWALWRQVHLPLLRGALHSAWLLLFAAILHELPLTLLLHPVGWDTLALRLLTAAHDQQWQHLALPAFALLLAGLPPTIGLARRINRHG